MSMTGRESKRFLSVALAAKILALLGIFLFSPTVLAVGWCVEAYGPNYGYLEQEQTCLADEAALVAGGGRIIKACDKNEYPWGGPGGVAGNWHYTYFTKFGTGPYGYGWDFFCSGWVKPEKNNGCPADGSCTGDPINAGTGNLTASESDYAGARWLHFSRFYNSTASAASDTMGPLWRHTYSRSLIYDGTASPPTAVLIHEDGRANTFVQQSGGTWASDQDVQDSLVETTDAGGAPLSWAHVRADSLDTETYDNQGLFTSIVDAKGFQTTLTYSSTSTPSSIAPAPGYLLTVSDPTGRTLNFTYATLGSFAATTGFLSTMTDSAGKVYHYGYDIYGNLVSVTYPGVSTPRTYAYNESAHTSGATLVTALTGITDENSNRYATFDYDSSGDATQTQHGGGADLFSLAYNSDGSTDVTDPQTNVTHRTFTVANDRVLAATTSGPSIPFSSIAARTYDAYNNRQTSTDFNGNSTCYTFDTAHGLETQRIEGVTTGCSATPIGLRTVQTDWDTALRVKTEVRVFDSTGSLVTTTQWLYNTRRQVIAQCEIDPSESYVCSVTTPPATGAKVRRTLKTYCDSIGTGCPLIGLLKTVIDPRSNTTTYTYYSGAATSGCGSFAGPCNAVGDLEMMTNALGQVTMYVSYDAVGRPVRVSDPNGTLTDLTYFPRGWLLTRTVRDNASGTPSSLDATTTFTYDNVGNVTRVTQPDGDYLAYVYDDAHRLTDVQDNLGNRVHYTLDAAGNRTAEQTYDPSSTLTRALGRQYGQLNRLQYVRNAAATSVQTYTNPAESPPSGITYTDGYDGNGNAIYSIDGTSNHVGTEQQYDPLNRLVKTLQDHAGTGATHDTQTQYAYDARDNLRSVTDPDNLTTSYTYDGLNNLTGLSSPDTGTTGYTYDAAGNRLTQTDARSVTTTYSYDALNRLTGITYPTSSLNVSYGYDQPNSTTGCGTSYPIGRLTTMADSSGNTVYCYDRRGNVTSKTQVTAYQSLKVKYSYTLADRLSTVTYPSEGLGSTPDKQLAVSFVRDAAGRVTSITYTTAPTDRFSKTLIRHVTYYPFGPPNVITFGDGHTLTKTYDQDYAIDSVASSNPAGLILDADVDILGNVVAAANSIGGSITQHFDFDPLYRVTGVDDGSGTPLQAFTYGATGDRLSRTDSSGTQTYLYPSPLTSHQLIGIGGTSRTYDQNGNTHEFNNGYVLTFDDRNRLAKETNPSLASVDYSYNGRGERIVKIIEADRPVFTAPATYEYGESGQLLVEKAEDLGTSKTDFNYIYFDGVPIGLVAWSVVPTHGHIFGSSTARAYYIETDQLGTPRIVESDTGSVVWKWDYFANNSAFGENTPSPQTITFNLRFPGQYFDQETNLNYNYFRDYEPQTGRYIESDPVGLAGGLSTYGYAEDRPTGVFDFFGLAGSDAGCCNAARQQIMSDPRNKDADGTVACCNGQKISCVWSEPGAGAAPASAIHLCKMKHEDEHQDNAPCPCGCGQTCLLGVPPADKNKDECKSYRVQLACLVEHQRDCGNNPQCRAAMTAEIARTTSLANQKYGCGFTR